MRAKFVVSEIVERESSPTSLWTVKLRAVSGDTPENKAFWAYTPAGTIELQVINRATAQQFTVGQHVYVDFTPVETAV